MVAALFHIPNLAEFTAAASSAANTKVEHNIVIAKTVRKTLNLVLFLVINSPLNICSELIYRGVPLFFSSIKFLQKRP